VRATPDAVVAFGCAALTFVVYLATTYPGVISSGDAAKYSFVGKVLGTPHAPGYPLYVMVSHVFSYLPVGPLAYRMNLMSATFASLAVALMYYAVRALGAERSVAVAIAVAAGFGHAFWSKALYPKGYALNAALVTAGVLALLRWRTALVRGDVPRAQAHRWLLAAIAIFAISIGNHLIVITLVPALLLYVLATDARMALSPKTLAYGAALVAAGFSQYLFILIRTHQGAPYLEARASTLTELVDVVTARRFRHEIGAFGWDALVDSRIPAVLGLAGRELGWLGLRCSLSASSSRCDAARAKRCSAVWERREDSPSRRR
jgi:hypothetical protein